MAMQLEMSITGVMQYCLNLQFHLSEDQSFYISLVENPTSIIPSQSPPTMKTLINVLNSTKPLFKALAKKFPEVASDSE